MIGYFIVSVLSATVGFLAASMCYMSHDIGDWDK